METMQLNVFDLPRDNILEVLPRFFIATKHDEAIAQFENIINEIRLDQLPQELAGHGKSDRYSQPAIPIEIKLGDRTSIDGNNLDVSGISTKSILIPETSNKHKKYGHIEPYQVKGRTGKMYTYQRYVYIDDIGVYRHHHIPSKLFEYVEEIWIFGASAKEICVALGKKYLGKDIS